MYKLPVFYNLTVNSNFLSYIFKSLIQIINADKAYYHRNKEKSQV